MRCHIIIIITIIDHIHSCDDYSSVPEGAWHSALQNQQLWFLHQFSPSTGLWLRGSGEVPGRLCWSCLQARHGSLWLMDVVRQGNLSLLHTREAVSRSERYWDQFGRRLSGCLGSLSFTASLHVRPAQIILIFEIMGSKWKRVSAHLAHGLA